MGLLCTFHCITESLTDSSDHFYHCILIISHNNRFLPGTFFFSSNPDKSEGGGGGGGWGRSGEVTAITWIQTCNPLESSITRLVTSFCAEYWVYGPHASSVCWWCSCWWCPCWWYSIAWYSWVLRENDIDKHFDTRGQLCCAEHHLLTCMAQISMY